ncbi:response regulator [Candidatus Poribacteria bacterium]
MGERVSILIVDDNISFSKTMSFILHHKGYAVVTAENGLVAIERVKEQPFDMIFIDIKMPPMNGVEAYRRIKKIRPEAVVVMMTAYSVEDLVQEALQEGAYGVIYKPPDPHEVLATIEEACVAKQGMLILIVDDDPRICVALKDILINGSYQVGVAHTGEEAIRMVHKVAYDIIFIDMKLPTMNGLETYLAIREINPELVAIMMTGYRQEMADLMEKALSNYAHTCLYKPFDMESVLQLVYKIRERK